MLDSVLGVLLQWLGGRTVWGRTLNPTADRQLQNFESCSCPQTAWSSEPDGRQTANGLDGGAGPARRGKGFARIQGGEE